MRALRTAFFSSSATGLPSGILLAALLLAPLPPRDLTAQRSLTIEQFTADLEVRENGDLRVMESLQVRFQGSWNGIYRTIPVVYRTPRGFNYNLFLDLESVTDESGGELEREVSRDGSYRKVKIWVPDARDAVRTVTLRYTVPNALKFFEEHDELYWNVTGTEWEMPIRSASALISLPSGATGLRGTAYTGPYGATTGNASVQELEQGFYIETTESLGFREGLTVVVGWDRGLVRRPGMVKKAGFFLRANWLFLLPILSLLLMFWIWRRWGKDPERRSIAPAYEPPEGMAPAEVGTLVDNRPDPRDVTATLVDLAVRGFLRIEELEEDALLGLVDKRDYRFLRLRDPEEWWALKPHERELLQGIFGASGQEDSIRLSELKNEFHTHLSEIRDQLYNGLTRAGYYRKRPDRVLGAFLVTGVVALGVGVPGFQLLAGTFMMSSGSALVAAILTAIPIIAFGVVMPARTQRGTRKLEEILGFQEFLDRVESDRFRRMITSPAMFEEYLPYAMALGVEERWARAFKDIYTEPPSWYVGRHPHSFHAGLFISDLTTMTSQAGSTMASQPRSTGGSGFSGGGGGGFSGGGFGGGGGGGF